MKHLLFSVIIILLLSSCSKDEFEPKPLAHSYGDTTCYISPEGINPEFIFCLYPYASLTVDADMNNDSVTYLWSPGGETSSSIKISASGFYQVQVSHPTLTYPPVNVIVEACLPTIYVPNSFTPDFDGIDDFWGPVYTNVTAIHVEVRDYDGVKLFSSDDLANPGWNGKYQDAWMPQGYYQYYINYSTPTTENNILTGSLQLLR